VGKLQAASMNFRQFRTATLIGPSTVVTAAHCVFNRRTQRSFPPGSLHFLIGYAKSGYAGHAVGISLKAEKAMTPLGQRRRSAAIATAGMSAKKRLRGSNSGENA
jgi:hypothetical protein